MAAQIRIDLANALRLAAESVGRMEIRVVIETGERLERDAELPAIIDHRMMVIGNAPGTWVEIMPLGEAAGLRFAAKFGDFVAAANAPVPAARTLVIFENADLVAGLAQLISRCQASQSGAENEN